MHKSERFLRVNLLSLTNSINEGGPIIVDSEQPTYGLWRDS